MHAAAAALIATTAAATASACPSGVPASVLALLDSYRNTGVQLREVEAARARMLPAIPLRFRSVTAGKGASRWPEWTRAKLKALGLPPSMPLRPSQTDFVLFSKYGLAPGVASRVEADRRHRVFSRFMARPAERSEGMVQPHRPRRD